MTQHKLILIGPGCWFIDSFRWFTQRGWKITVIQTCHNTKWFYPNYRILQEIGAEVITYKPEQLKELPASLSLNPSTLILGGGNYAGDAKSFYEFKTTSQEELEIFYQITSYNNIQRKGAISARFFNGDTMFASNEAIKTFTQKTRYADYLLFDNSLLREFVFFNIPALAKKPSFLGWIETPLKQFVRKPNLRYIDRRFVSLGRNITSSRVELPAPLLSFPLPRLHGVKKRIHNFQNWKLGLQDTYWVAGGVPLKQMEHDRMAFYRSRNAFAFGLSHMYDCLSGGEEDFKKYKNLFFSAEGQRFALRSSYPGTEAKEAIYQFINNPSKDVTYLMNGIIPLISHTEHNWYHELVERKMALQVCSQDDFKIAMSMPDEEIFAYRRNIYENRELFTFDHTAERLVALLQNQPVPAFSCTTPSVSVDNKTEHAVGQTRRKLLFVCTCKICKALHALVRRLRSTPPPPHFGNLISCSLLAPLSAFFNRIPAVFFSCRNAVILFHKYAFAK